MKDIEEKDIEFGEKDIEFEEEDTEKESDDVGKEEQRITRSVSEELKKDVIGSYWMMMERNESFDDEISVYTVEVPRKEHGKNEVIAAKEKEVENLKKYGTFEEMEDEGKEKITSRWVVTKKTKQDGQKEDFKARLVARGFQEMGDPQSDSPTALRESAKLFYSIAANENFNLRSIDIKAAFLQSNELDRDVILEPPADIKKEGIVWRLVKPLYGLKDASRKFWLRMKEIFSKEGFKSVKGDKAFYFKYKGKKLIGMILTHVVDFGMAGEDKFLDEMEEKIGGVLNVSKVEKNKFRFTGIYIE